MTTPENQTGVLCAQIRKSLKRRKPHIVTAESLFLCKLDPHEDDIRTIERIAARAKCDWLFQDSTGEVRFWEGN